MLRTIILACVTLAGLVLAAAAQAPRPIEVTSDSAAYCQQLATRIIGQRQRLSTVEPDVDTLLDRGQRLCATGRVRAGLNRLRHALHEMNEARQEEMNERERDE